MRLLIAAALLAAAPLPAQTVRGRVLESGSNQPLVGAFVTLLDSAGVQRAGVLSDSAGGYIFPNTPAGQWRLRAEVIGHRSFQSALFDALATPVINIALPVQAISLAAVEAKAKHRCTVRPEAGAQTMRVWEEVRKALKVTAWAQTAQPAAIMAATYRRILDPVTLDVQAERIERSVTSGRAYSAIDPRLLADNGFVQQAEGDSLAYYGPDADVLLSDVFLDSHCFAVVKKGTDVGLSFKPAPGRKLADIEGTLWIAPNGELKRIDFDYVRLAAPFSHFRASGRTDFRRLPDGLWIVDQWYIRSPIVGQTTRGDYKVIGYGESGGRVVDIKTK